MKRCAGVRIGGRCVVKKYAISVDNAWAGKVIGKYPDWEWTPEEYPNKQEAIENARRLNGRYVHVWEKTGVNPTDKKVVWANKCPAGKTLYGNKITGSCVNRKELSKWRQLRNLKQQGKLDTETRQEFKRLDFFMGAVKGGIAIREEMFEAGNLPKGKYLIDKQQEMF